MRKALAQHPREFSPIYTAVIGAGEQSGHLGLVLERLADDLEEQQALKAKLIGAALYPAIVTLVAIAIVMFLVGYVVPQVANVFAGTKRALPFLTVAMLGISGFVRSYGWFMLVALVVDSYRRACGLAQRGISRKIRCHLADPAAARQARARLQRGALCQHAGHAGGGRRADPQGAAGRRRNPEQPRHARRCARCAGAGARRRAAGLRASGRKSASRAWSACLRGSASKPASCRVMLQRAANQLGAEVQRRAMQLATILEPLLIVAMGLVVMLIVLAVLLPIIQLNQLVK